MRFIQLKGDGTLKLTKDLASEELPKYAIVSHTWLLESDQEITFDDLMQGNTHHKPIGHAKIEFCTRQAAKDGLEYVWLDTCCIKRDSSAELQEALQTMFTWYRNATRCYAYLTDVSAKEVPAHSMKELPEQPWELAFRNSRWFTRGWTLQELLAPASVEFFSAEGIRLGDKKSLESVIHEITEIPYEALRGHSMANFSIDQRLSWAANRYTKRIEDKAYCLLGIFNIYMTLIYGEGEHAFERLRQKIDRKHAENAKLDQILSMLPVASEAAFDAPHNQHEPTCLQDTRVKILRDIEKWVDGSDKMCVFWQYGMPGVGKSTIARTIARIYQDRGILGGSFFFSRGGGDLSRSSKLAATLSRQLAIRLPPAKRFICEAIDEKKDAMNQSLGEQWQRLIINPLSKLHGEQPRATVLIVIDALDECENESDIRVLLKALSTATSLINIRLRIFITSRSDTLIRHGLRQIPEVDRELFVLQELSPHILDRDLGVFLSNHVSAIREEGGFDDNWPDIKIVNRLADISCGLFICASTACRHIRAGRLLAKSRMRALTNENRSSTDPERQLDQIYTSVLRDSIQRDHSEEGGEQGPYLTLRELLGSIVILCSPLSVESLTELLAMSLSDAKDILDGLHTIFHIPQQTSRPLRLRHLTFRDFLLDKRRCSDSGFWVDEKKAHEALADCCLTLMSMKLKRDICDLGSKCRRINEVDRNQIEHCIPPDLQYACLYWVEHYRQSGISLSDGDKVDHFFREYFLHWLEAIILMGKSAEMGAIIRIYHSLLAPENNARQLPFIKDARRFMVAVHDIIKEAPLKIYGEALAFIPSSNKLKSHFWSQVHPWMNEIGIAEPISPMAKDEFNYVSDLAFTPDSKQIASGSNFEAVRFWDVATRAGIAKYEGSMDKMSSVAISPDGMILAAGSDDFTVMAWDIKTKKLRFSVKAHSGWVNSVVFSPDGKSLASGAMDETVALWDASTGREIKRFDNQSSSVNTATFSPDGSLIATGSVDQMIRLWDVSNDSEDLRITLDGHSGCVNSVRFSPDGTRIISGSDDMTVKVWDTGSGVECMTLKGHRKMVMAVAFSPDARFIVSGSGDKTVKLWDARSGALLRTMRDHASGINSVQFSPNGKLLGSSSYDDEVKLWDTETWKLIGDLDDFEEGSRERQTAQQRSKQGYSYNTLTVLPMTCFWLAGSHY